MHKDAKSEVARDNIVMPWTSYPEQRESKDQSEQSAVSDGVFLLETSDNGAGQVLIIGKANRKKANALINVPVSENLRHKLSEQVVGSLAMGTSALLEWALDELKRRKITLQARPRV
jgi:hypothetical protein